MDKNVLLNKIFKIEKVKTDLQEDCILHIGIDTFLDGSFDFYTKIFDYDLDNQCIYVENKYIDFSEIKFIDFEVLGEF